MNVLAFFTHNGIPKTGLVPTVRIRDVSNDILVVTDSTSSEIGDGWYKYDFTDYDRSKEYAIRFDGGPTLTNQERYTYGTNDSFMDDITYAVWEENYSDHINEGSFGGLLQRIVGLMHENIFIDNPTYDDNNNLVEARVRIYSNKTSVGTDNNVIGIYKIESDGDGAGKFTTWKQIKQ